MGHVGRIWVPIQSPSGRNRSDRHGNIEASGAKVRHISVGAGEYPQDMTLGRKHLLAKLQRKKLEGQWDNKQ